MTQAPTNSPAAPAPISISDLAIPEGYEVDNEIMTPFLDVMNNPNLSPAERANAILGLQVKASEAASARGSAQLAKTAQDWADAARADPVIGGANMTKTLSGISSLIDQFAPQGQADALRGIFDLGGVGNNPVLIHFLNNVSRALTEGGHVTGQPTTGGAPRTTAEVLYPNLVKGA